MSIRDLDNVNYYDVSITEHDSNGPLGPTTAVPSEVDINRVRER